MWPQGLNSKELTEACTRGGACGLIRYTAQNLTNFCIWCILWDFTFSKNIMAIVFIFVYVCFPNCKFTFSKTFFNKYRLLIVLEKSKDKATRTENILRVNCAISSKVKVDSIFLLKSYFQTTVTNDKSCMAVVSSCCEVCG